MEFTKKAQNLKKGLNRLSHRFREQGRRICAVLLCASMVISGFPGSFFQSFASDGTEEYCYELEREALYEAICTAVSEGTTVDKELDFKGEYAEKYAALFDADGTLYELKDLEVEKDRDRDKVLNLRAFVRIEGDIPLDESYVIDGEESVIFLLTNRSKDATSAVIFVDDLETETIEVVSAASVSRDGGPGSKSVAEAALEAAGSEADGSVAEISSEDQTELNENEAAEGAEKDSEISIDESIKENADAETDDEDSLDTAESSDSEDDDDGSDKDTGTGDVESSDGEGSSSDASDNSSDNDSSESKDSSDSGDKSEGRDHSGRGDRSDRDNNSDRGDRSDRSDNDHSDRENNSKDRGFSGGRVKTDGGRDHSGSSSDSKDSSDSSSKSSSDSGSEKSDKTASVSSNRVGLLSASVQEDIVIEEENYEQGDEAGEAVPADDIIVTAEYGDDDIIITIDEGAEGIAITTDSDVIITSDSEVTIASVSDADEEDSSDNTTGNTINGEIYDAVILDAKKAAVAFVTTAEDLGLEKLHPIAQETTYTAEDGGITVNVTAPAGALPKNAELSVTRFSNDSDEFAAAADAIGHGADDTNMAALDISFFDADGDEIEPSDEVQVSIDVSDILPADADAGTLKVTHLENSSFLFGLFKSVKSVVVADEDEGYIDEDNAIIEFSVDSFSVFTVEWNDGTTDTIEVHVYNINGTSINETLDEPSEQIANGGTIAISELVAHLQSNSTLASEYTYQYATVIYETDLDGPGYSSDTLGGADNSVTSISKNGTTYRVTFADGTPETVSDPALIKINLYYSTPTITLNTEDPYGDTVSFTTDSEYFQHEDEGTTTYAWALSNDKAGTLTLGTDEDVGTATFAWDTDTAQAGDQVTVTVTKTVTYTDSEGTEKTEVASDTYTLTYGEDPVTFTVTLNGTPQAYAHVAIVDTDGNTISTGITDENGQVTLYTIDGGTYTVGVTYCVADTSGMGGGSTSRYTAEGTVTLSDDGTVVTGDTTLALGNAIVSGPNGDTSGITGGLVNGAYYYEHIDVKVAAAGTEDTQVNFSDLDAVYVYDKYGNLIYVSDDLERNPDTGDYNCLFDINGSEDQHSIVVSSEDTIVIVYEVVDSDGNYSTYTATYKGGGTYPSGEYYPYDAVNAFQLYNYINSTSYTETQFEAMVESGELTGNGIDIGGMGYTEVADCLCDTRTTDGQAGLDFVIYVTEIEDIFGQYDFRVAKTLEGTYSTLTADNIEVFTFELQDVSSVTDGDTYSEGIWTTTGDPISGSTSADSWTQGDDGNWNAVVDFANALTYTAEDGTYFYYYVLSEQDPDTAIPSQQYYGIKVTVSYSSSTGVAEIVASYCDLTKADDNGTYNRASTWMELDAQTGYDEDSGEEYTYFSIPFVNTYYSITYPVDVYKYDSTTNEPLWNVSFMLWSISDGEEEGFADFTYDSTTGIYTLNDWIPAGTALGNYNYQIFTDEQGYIHIAGLEPGDYWLEEENPLEGYKRIEQPISFTVNEDGTITSEYWSDDMNAITIPNDEEIINVRKTDSNGNPLEGAEFVMGRIEQNAIDISIPIEGTDYHYEYLTFTEDTETGTYVYIPDGEVDTRVEATTLITVEDGYIHLRELNTGTLYFLVETKAPEGYEILEDPIVFWVDYDGSITIYIPQEDGDISVSGTTITVVNYSGRELPKTGGSGTFPFCAVGTFLSGSALWLLFLMLRRKRRWIES